MQELEQLQKKISNLNLAHMDNSGRGHSSSLAGGSASIASLASLPGAKQEEVAQKDELAKELVMIESTIRDREREISINHMRIQAADASGRGNGGASQDTPAGSMVHYDRSGKGIMTTAVSGLCAANSKKQ